MATEEKSLKEASESKELIVGGEIESLCTRCKKPTLHIITSLVKNRAGKVQCRTCGGVHRYRNPDAPLRKARKRSSQPPPEEVWGKMINLVGNQKKIPYTFSGVFKVNDLIDHNTFGLGVVTSLPTDDKIQVIFKDGEKVLIANRE